MSNHLLKRTLIALAAVLCLAASTPAPASAKTATVETYGDYSMMFNRVAGQYAAGAALFQWAWVPQSTTESHVYWGFPSSWPPAYRERFLLNGDWVVLDGWWDNGTYYSVKTDVEWQANADCRTGRVFLPAGSGQHYVRWSLPSTAYCLYAQGTITEQLSGKSFTFIHQQVWSPPTACPANAVPPRNLSNQLVPVSSCISQWESWADDNATPMGVKVERTMMLAKGLGEAYQIRQTFPSVWSADMKHAWGW